MLFLPTEGTHNRVRLLIKGREPERGLSCFMTMYANPTNRHEELQARTGQNCGRLWKNEPHFSRIADGSRHRDAMGLRKVHGHPTVAVQEDRSYAGKRQEKTEEASDNSVSCVHAVYNEHVIRSVDEDRRKRL